MTVLRDSWFSIQAHKKHPRAHSQPLEHIEEGCGECVKGEGVGVSPRTPQRLGSQDPEIKWSLARAAEAWLQVLPWDSLPWITAARWTCDESLTHGAPQSRHWTHRIIGLSPFST